MHRTTTYCGGGHAQDDRPPPHSWQSAGTTTDSTPPPAWRAQASAATAAATAAAVRRRRCARFRRGLPLRIILIRCRALRWRAVEEGTPPRLGRIEAGAALSSARWLAAAERLLLTKGVGHGNMHGDMYGPWQYAW